ncbi:MAG: ROK family protein [Bacillota bacterium]
MERAYAVDLGGTNLRAALVARGKVLERNEMPTPCPCPEEKLLAAVKSLIASLQGEAERIGIGVPGLVAHGGRVELAPNLGWRHVDVAGLFEREMGTAVLVENDANAAAWGEFRFGAGAGALNLACVTLGTGVGMGLVLRGKLYRGSRGWAGELGHTGVYSDRMCGCGRIGCLETVVGGAYIRRYLGVSPRELFRPGQVHDHLLAERARITEALGTALANLAQLLDLDLIVLAGRMVQAGPELIDPVRRQFERLVLTKTRLVMGTLGDDAGLVGVADLALLGGKS